MWISFANSSIRQINKINGSPSSRWAEPGKKPFDLIMLIEFGRSCGAAQRPKGRTPKSQTKATQRRKKSDAAIITFQTIILFQFCRCFFFCITCYALSESNFFNYPGVKLQYKWKLHFFVFYFLVWLSPWIANSCDCVELPPMLSGTGCRMSHAAAHTSMKNGLRWSRRFSELFCFILLYVIAFFSVHILDVVKNG